MRLIDADKIDFGKVCVGPFDFARDTRKAVKELIDSQPTALDLESVIEELEKQGLMLKLPCKVGDYIWDNDFGKPCGYEVTGFSFGNLNQDDLENKTVFDQVIVYYTSSSGSITGNFAVSEIGKTVFLTQGEAEKTLRKMEDKAREESED